MTKAWAHFEHPLAPITTNDLHLTWDVPFDLKAQVVISGRDRAGNEVLRQELCHAGASVALNVHADRAGLPADGRAAIQLELSLLDADGQLVTSDDRRVSVTVSGGWHGNHQFAFEPSTSCYDTRARAEASRTMMRFMPGEERSFGMERLFDERSR